MDKNGKRGGEEPKRGLKAWVQEKKLAAPNKIHFDVLSKAGDPGIFTIPCSIGSVYLEGALADTGIDTNAITNSLFKLTKEERWEKLKVRVISGGSCVYYRKGNLTDFPVVINGTIIPTDFIIIGSANEMEDPPIVMFGRTFLETVGASLDFEAKTLTLKKVDNLKLPITTRGGPTNEESTIPPTNEEHSIPPSNEEHSIPPSSSIED